MTSQITPANRTSGLTTTLARFAVLGLVVVALGACGDDSDSKSDSAPKTSSTTAAAVAVTPAEWAAQVEDECASFEPGFDGFYAEHPEPTAADYAEFLPTQVDGLNAMAECIEGRPAPDEVAAEADAVVAAMRVVVTDWEQALAAAEADDLDGVDESVGRAHDTDALKIDEAFSALMAKIEG